MAPIVSTESTENGLDRVRARILTALHLGRLRPGDRVPSVRRLAEMSGLNHKTVHRAYGLLAEEGLLEVRRGSGTFVREREQHVGPPEPGAGTLVSSLNRCRAEAMRIGLRPHAFAKFVEIALGDGLRGLPVAVAECNGEQRGIIRKQLEEAIGVTTLEVSIQELDDTHGHAVRGAWAVVTTDCHVTEVARHVEPQGLPVYSVALDGEFPARVAHLASSGPTLLVVRDRAFEPVFVRLLRQLHVPEDRLERLVFAEPREAPLALSRMPAGAAVWVSPVVEGEVDRQFPRAGARPGPWWSIHPVALDRLRASLALDAALRHRPA